MKSSVSLFCLGLTILTSACHKKDNNDGYTYGVNWQQMLGGTNWDGANDAKKTADGGLIVTGYSKSADGDLTGNKGAEDILVAKLDASGNRQWVKNFGGSAADNGNAVVTTPDGGYLIAGTTQSSDGDIPSNQGNSDFVILKLDASGNKSWVKTYGSSKLEETTSIISTLDGGYLLLGSTTSTDGIATGNHGGSDIMLIKLNESGDKQWVKLLGGSLNELPGQILATADGGYMLCGSSESKDGDISNNKGGFDYLLMKLDASANKVWDKTYGGSGSDYARGLTVPYNNEYVLTGNTNSTNGDVGYYHGGASDIWVVYAGASGTKLWERTFGGPQEDFSSCITPGTDGRFIVGGFSNSKEGETDNNKGGYDLLFLNLTINGTLAPSSFGGSLSDQSAAIIPVGNRTYVVAGHSGSTDGDFSGNHGNEDAFLMKLGL
ncbi:hypothetical protein A3860_08490 [Niastella vici]|uniref:Bulb-type lectin domain-containing protein n=1 Tax=Niastella vici TaxID=1703345 RepID=A0A1V9FH51_9BACT|nr:hypothetical protein [Niastella vici]OQP57660.1 hypothetical protein A3860_08490 [Niastella vici]